MSQLIRGGALVENDWTPLADDADLPSSGKVVVSLERLRAGSASLRSSGLGLGVRLANTEDVILLREELQGLQLVALEFPKSGDGRAFSQARLLRERLGFTGEIRATGDVQRDQLQFMRRCGFDAFDLRADQDPVACMNAFTDFDLAYQSAVDTLPNVWALRRAAG